MWWITVASLEVDDGRKNFIGTEGTFEGICQGARLGAISLTEELGYGPYCRDCRTIRAFSVVD